MKVKTKFKVSSFQIILLGFAAVIFIGAFMRGNKTPVLPEGEKESGATKEKASITQA